MLLLVRPLTKHTHEAEHERSDLSAAAADRIDLPRVRTMSSPDDPPAAASDGETVAVPDVPEDATAETEVNEKATATAEAPAAEAVVAEDVPDGRGGWHRAKNAVRAPNIFMRLRNLLPDRPPEPEPEPEPVTDPAAAPVVVVEEAVSEEAAPEAVPAPTVGPVR